MKQIKTSRGRVAAKRVFTKGEIAVVKSMISNDVKTPINQQKCKQKTIGAKKRTTHHRSM